MQSNTARVAQVFWGLLIVAVDLRAGRFDVLPDFVGYILIALGAAGLVGWSSHFQTARLVSWSLVPIPIALLLFSGVFLKVLGLINLVLEGALMWFLLGGVIAFAQSRSRQHWVDSARNYRWAYLGLIGVALFTSLIASAVPSLARVIASITLVATLVVLAAILYLLHQVKGEAAKSTASPAPSTQQDETVKEAA